MKKWVLIVLLCIPIVVGSFLIYHAYTQNVYRYYHSPLIINNVSFDFEVGAEGGINADPGAFHFGIVPQKGASARKFNITNSFSVPVCGHALIASNESLGEWFEITPEYFYIPVNYTQNLQVKIYVPDNATFGNYSGLVLFPMYDATFFNESVDDYIGRICLGDEHFNTTLNVTNSSWSNSIISNSTLLGGSDLNVSAEGFVEEDDAVNVSVDEVTPDSLVDGVESTSGQE